MPSGKHFDRYDDEIFDALYKSLACQQDSLSPYATKDKYATRRVKEVFHVARPNFVRDTDRILHCRYYNRYADKTQVFSLYKNDDITRRILHVQIVSRIARNIGRMLNLNQDLIESIALGHDLGHAPFGHAGERYLSSLYCAHTGRYFNHNVQSVRILDDILRLNLTLQTLDGILCHNGEKVSGVYYPFRYPEGGPDEKFACLAQRMEQCYTEKDGVDHLIPGTLEGCVVRISDIIAYLGKDRQDAMILGKKLDGDFEASEVLGSTNSEFIANIIANLVNGSYGKDYLALDPKYAQALATEKELNYKIIYAPEDTNRPYEAIQDMFSRIYDALLKDLQQGNEQSPVFRHHIDILYRGHQNEKQYRDEYLASEPNQIVVDYIASMTDDYFIDLCEYLFPGSVHIAYRSYFSDRPV